MALPTPVIEKLSTRSSGTPGWYGQLFVLALGVFAIAAVVYVGLQYAYLPYLGNNIDALKKDAETFAGKVPVKDQEKLIVYYSQINNLSKILKTRTIATPLMAWLEKTTLPSISFSNAGLSTANSEVKLTGVAKTAQDLSGQVLQYQNDPDVKNAVLGNVSLLPIGQWQFSLTVTFRNGYFQAYQPSSTPALIPATSTPPLDQPAASTSVRVPTSTVTSTATSTP